MMMKKSFVLALCCAVIFLLIGAGAHAEQSGACVTCHTFLGGRLAKPVAEWKGSIHQQNGITCDLCHGGNASVDVGTVQNLAGQEFADRMSRAMSKSKGFIGKPSGKTMFAMCSKCHGDSVDRYARSIMGKSYLENKGGPSCVTCHNAHRNAMPDVPKVCESCHKDTEGFDQIDPMDVTASTVNALSGIRIKIAQAKMIGKQPPFIPEFPEDLDAFQIGFVAFGAVLVLFCLGYIVYVVLERRE
jgi:hypothetical protein